MADEIEQPAPPPATAPAPATGMNWPKATLWMVVTLVVTVNVLLVFKSCLNAPANLAEKTGQAIGKAGNALATVAAAFNRGTITTSFVSYATSVSNHQYLQFANLKKPLNRAACGS